MLDRSQRCTGLLATALLLMLLLLLLFLSLFLGTTPQGRALLIVTIPISIDLLLPSRCICSKPTIVPLILPLSPSSSFLRLLLLLLLLLLLPLVVLQLLVGH